MITDKYGTLSIKKIQIFNFLRFEHSTSFEWMISTFNYFNIVLRYIRSFYHRSNEDIRR